MNDTQRIFAIIAVALLVQACPEKTIMGESLDSLATTTPDTGSNDTSILIPCGDGVCANGESSGTCPADCTAQCGDGLCTVDETQENCPADCSSICGDGQCDGGETTINCVADCGTHCGDGVCHPEEGSALCPQDCSEACGDGECSVSENTINCVTDCGTVCGDSACNGDETTALCPEDCGATCGDGQCNGPETTVNCVDDCGVACGDGACNGTESSLTCTPDCGSICGDGTCNGSESTANCSGDCGSQCGDDVCNGDESTANCPADCGTFCGDGVCADTEINAPCPADCGSKCGDNLCSDDENTANCEPDCGSQCGDNACNGSETPTVCPADCGSQCNDGICNGDEGTATCPADCGTLCGDSACNGDETTASCVDDCGSLCGDNACNGDETTANCEPDCGNQCGDGACNGSETSANCPSDCGSFCGDSICNGDETTANCHNDCGSLCDDGTCNGTESTTNCIADCGTLCGDTKCNGDETHTNCPADCKGAPVVPPVPPTNGPTLPADFSGVVWLHHNVSQWEESATLSSVTFEGADICLNYDKSSVWPGVVYQPKPDVIVNANPWIFIHQNGTWYAATWEWLRPKQTCKGSSKVDGWHIKKSPIASDWKPVPGETYYFMVSGLARDYPAHQNVQKRSNPLKVVWGSGSNPPTNGCETVDPIFNPQRETWRAEGNVTVSGDRFKVNNQVYYPTTDFLSAVAPGGENWKTHSSLWYLSVTASKKAQIRNALVDQQYNSIYLYTLNKDKYIQTPYGGGGWSLNTNDLNQGRINQWKADVNDLIYNHQLKPFIFLAGDDSGLGAGGNKESGGSMTQKIWEAYVDDMIDAFEEYPVVWIIGLEVDEYWSVNRVQAYRQYLMSKTKHPVGVHFTIDETEVTNTPYKNGFDFVMGQFESTKTKSNAAFVNDMQSYAMKGSPFVASEFNVYGTGDGAEQEVNVTERSKAIGAVIAGVGNPPLAAGIGNGMAFCGGTSPPPPNPCGNGQCDASENCKDCPADCGCQTGEQCNNSGQCVCGPAPTYQMLNGACVTSCGHLINTSGWSDGACCSLGCTNGGTGLNGTWDCNYCCEGANSCAECADANDCDSGFECVSGKCKCPYGFEESNGVCLTTCGHWKNISGWTGVQCCSTGCKNDGLGPNGTLDCNYCCEGDNGCADSPDPPTPECSAQADCDPGVDCINGKCVDECGINGCKPGVEDCKTCPGDCPCGPGTSCNNAGQCEALCGNNQCDAGENCKSCPTDCGCKANTEYCSDAGQCQPECGSNGCKPGFENCLNCPGDCPCAPGTSCNNTGQCEALCGNNQCDAGENCKSCPGDCGCKANIEFCSDAGQCLPECGSNGCKPGFEDCKSCPGDCPCGPGTSCNNTGQCIEQGVAITSGAKVALKSKAWDRYCAAEDFSENIVNCNRTTIDSWEQYKFTKLNGSGALKSGDMISIYSLGQTGYCAAEDIDYHIMHCNRPGVGDWEKYIITKVSGSGTISSIDAVTIKSVEWGKYCRAVSGGKHQVYCNGSAAGNEERYTLTPM